MRGKRFGNPEVLRWAIDGHVVGAENPIPEDEQTAEVFVPRLAILGMMPAVKDRSGDDAAQGAEIPVDIGVDENGVEGEDRRGGERDEGIETEQENRGGLAQFGDQIVHGMHPDTAQPVEVFRTVMDGVEGPPSTLVKEPVAPVADEIREKKNLDDLKPDRLPGERTKAPVGAGLEGLDGRSPEPDEEGQRENQTEPREPLRDEGGEKPKAGVHAPATPQEWQPAPPAQEALDDEEQRRKKPPPVSTNPISRTRRERRERRQHATQPGHP